MNNSLTKSKKRVKELGEVFTPSSLIKEVLNKIPACYWSKNKNILEPSCGNGNFLIAILNKKVEYGNDIISSLKSIYGIDIMEDNVTDSRKRILKESLKLGLKNEDLKEAVAIIKRNIIQGNALELDLSRIWPII